MPLDPATLGFTVAFHIAKDIHRLTERRARLATEGATDHTITIQVDRLMQQLEALPTEAIQAATYYYRDNPEVMGVLFNDLDRRRLAVL